MKHLPALTAYVEPSFNPARERRDPFASAQQHPVTRPRRQMVNVGHFLSINKLDSLLLSLTPIFQASTKSKSPSINSSLRPLYLSLLANSIIFFSVTFHLFTCGRSSVPVGYDLVHTFSPLNRNLTFSIEI